MQAFFGGTAGRQRSNGPLFLSRRAQFPAARPRHGESITLSLLAAAEEETRKAAAGAHPECGFYEIKVEVQEKRGNSSL
jgi:hypothetical protein